MIALIAFTIPAIIAVVLLGDRLRLRRELADMTDDRDVQAFRAVNAEGQLAIKKVDRDELLDRAFKAEADADRLYPIAKEHLETIDLIETKLPPDAERMDVSKEREAIRLHEEAVKSRTK